MTAVRARNALVLAALASGLALRAADARAQVVDVPAALADRAVPAAPGWGVQVMAVHAFFNGTPQSLGNARDILAGTAITPVFDAWCGSVPYVDFTNAANVDSLGLEAPAAMCLPFIDPAADAPHPCRRLAGLPTGHYSTNGGEVLRLRGLFAVRSAGTLTFAWGHDDGMAFDIGNLAVFAYADPTAPRVDRVVLRFAAPGLYPFQLDWFDTTGGALIDWYVAPGEHPTGDLAATGFALFPSQDLDPSGALPCTPDCRRCEGATPVCDVAASRCVACAGDADCADGQRCASGSCVARTQPDAGWPTSLGDAGARSVRADAGLDAGASASFDGGTGGCAVSTPATRSGVPWVTGALGLCLRRRKRREGRGA